MLAKGVIVAGLALTIAGAFTLSWRDLLGKAFSMSELGGPGRQRAAWVGFPLIAVGSVLQMTGVLLD